MTSKLSVGGRSVGLDTAAGWIRSYFDEAANRDPSATRNKPYAYPVYDQMATGSGPNELNDGDLLAPLLLNAGPSIRGVFSLQAVRAALQDGLAAIPLGLTLQEAVADDSHKKLLEPLIAVLDAPGKVPGVQLTMLTKVLHRKRPLFIPLFDSQVKACYWSTDDHFPMQPDPTRPDAEFFSSLAACIAADLDGQLDVWQALRTEAPDSVPLLRILDVVAWNLGRKQ